MIRDRAQRPTATMCSVVVLSLVLVACGEPRVRAPEAAGIVHVGALPDSAEPLLVELYAPLLAYLTSATGLDFELYIPEDYDSLVDAFDAGKVDLARFGGLTFSKARARSNAQPLVSRDIDPRFTTVFVVASDAQGDSVEAFAGKQLAFGPRLSTSGHLMPRKFLDERGIRPEAFFGNVRYSRAHDETLAWVRDGVVAIGAVNGQIVKTLFRKRRRERLKPRRGMRALGTGLVGLAGLGLGLAVFMLDRQDAAIQSDLKDHHLGSVSLASGLELELARVSSNLQPVEQYAMTRDRLRHDLRAALAGAGQREARKLEALQLEHGVADGANRLDAVTLRLDRFVSLLERHLVQGEELDAGTVQVSFDSLALAVEQLRRLHGVEANEHIAAMPSVATKRNRTVAVIEAFFAAGVVAIGLGVGRLLERAFAREKELHDSLERANRNQQRAIKMEALGRLAGGVAHDFNNLLSVVLGHSEHIHQSLDSANPLRLETEAIDYAVDQAAALTRQLLTFSRSDPSEPRRVVLNELIGGMEFLLSRLLGERCTLTTTLSPDLGAVYADPREIERVLLDLVSNAGDAMPTGGTVVIETVNSQRNGRGDAASEADEQGFVRLSVCDTGAGMDDDIQERVFEPYFTTKAANRGSGLGLATVHGLVAKLGGSIEIESEAGIGTRIDVYLPRCEEDPGDDVAPRDPDSVPPSETILLVEDAAGVRRTSARTLRKAGYTVLESPDGSAALDLCNQHRGRIDLILTDLMMPGLTGPELADRAKALHSEAHVLFISGYTRAELPPGGKLLTKPFRADQLLREVRLSLSPQRPRMGTSSRGPGVTLDTVGNMLGRSR